MGGNDATMAAKAANDAAAYARSIAERRGRNGDWAAKAVLESASLTETQALKEKVIDLILRSRQLTKLKSTYVDALPLLVTPETGRVHTSFNQTLTAPCRVSSSEPNL